MELDVSYLEWSPVFWELGIGNEVAREATRVPAWSCATSHDLNLPEIASALGSPKLSESSTFEVFDS